MMLVLRLGAVLERSGMFFLSLFLDVSLTSLFLCSAGARTALWVGGVNTRIRMAPILVSIFERHLPPIVLVKK